MNSTATIRTGDRVAAAFLTPGTLGTHSVTSEWDNRLSHHATAPKIFHSTILLQVTRIPSSFSPSFHSPSNAKCTKLNISLVPLGSQATCKQQQQTAATTSATAQAIFSTECTQALNPVLKSHHHVSGVDWQGY